MTQPYRRDEPIEPQVAIPGSAFTVPPHLPPPWTEPGDATAYFERDITHFPRPVSTLDFDFIRHGVNHGLQAATERFHAPFRSEMRRFWTYVYNLEVPYVDPSEVEKVWNTTTRAAFAPLFEDLGRNWDEMWLPEIRATQRAWTAFDLRSVQHTELAAHLARVLDQVRRIWEIHFEVVFAVAHAWDMYVESYSELFEGSTRLDAMALLEGMDNLTAAAGRGVWRLAELAAPVPSIVAVIATADPAEMLAKLRDTPGSEAFLAEFEDYMQSFGRRSTSFSLRSRALYEDPAPVMSQLKDALMNPEADPRLHAGRRDEDRERAIAAARDALAHYPQELRDEFERRLKRAQVAVRLKEDHNFIIDFECTAAVRAVIVEAARRLVAAGVIDDPEEVHHLELTEVQAAIEALATGGPAVPDLRSRIAERASEMERYAKADVPAKLGTPPPGPPAAAERPTLEPGTFKGVGMSAGVGRGVVRVARSFDDASALRPGEVLVAVSTSQPWTPLFATAAALVTEAGGVLSHMGVIAREYRLPAVSGITNATQVLSDGMVIEVDGLAGTVKVLPDG